MPQVVLELERVKRHLRAQNKSEKVEAAQVQLAFAEVANLIVPPELAAQVADDENKQAIAANEKKKSRHGRNKLPADLPRERIELHPPSELLVCGSCGQTKHSIGEETCHRLDYRPASLILVEVARVKHACSCEQDGVVIASVPDAPVDKGLAGPGLLAHVAVSKYADHLPLHRLEEIFLRQGVHITRSTMGHWIKQIADLLRPIANAMARASLAAHRIHTDDTGFRSWLRAKPRRATLGLRRRRRLRRLLVHLATQRRWTARIFGGLPRLRASGRGQSL
jgi:transposase